MIGCDPLVHKDKIATGKLTNIIFCLQDEDVLMNTKRYRFEEEEIQWMVISFL